MTEIKKLDLSGRSPFSDIFPELGTSLEESPLILPETRLEIVQDLFRDLTLELCGLVADQAITKQIIRYGSCKCPSCYKEYIYWSGWNKP